MVARSLILSSAITMAVPAWPAAASVPEIDRVYAAGRCIVERDRSAAVDLILALPLGRERASLPELSPTVGRRCGPAMQSVPAIHLRGALAQALFLNDFRGYGLQPSRSIPLVNLDIPVQDSPAGDAITELYRLADCIARNDNERIERLLSTRPGSENEARVMTQLSPYLRACSPNDGMSIARSDLRSAIAQSAYQSMYRYWTRQLRSVRNR